MGFPLISLLILTLKKTKGEILDRIWAKTAYNTTTIKKNVLFFMRVTSSKS